MGSFQVHKNSPGLWTWLDSVPSVLLKFHGWSDEAPDFIHAYTLNHFSSSLFHFVSMFASQSDLTQRHLFFLFQPLGHMGWSVRQCWLMNRSYSHSIQLVYNIIRNGSKWQKNRGLPLIFLLHPNILYATYAIIYIYPPIKSKHIPLFKSFWSNQPISAHTLQSHPIFAG